MSSAGCHGAPQRTVRVLLPAACCMRHWPHPVCRGPLRALYRDKRARIPADAAAGEQMPVSWQPITTLYCVRTFYEPSDPSDLTVRPAGSTSAVPGARLHPALPPCRMLLCDFEVPQVVPQRGALLCLVGCGTSLLHVSQRTSSRHWHAKPCDPARRRSRCWCTTTATEAWSTASRWARAASRALPAQLCVPGAAAALECS